MHRSHAVALNSRSWSLPALLALALLVPQWAGAQGFTRMVVFGTSLSDPGNAFALIGGTTNPPYYSLIEDNLIPTVPYVGGGSGSHHFSNGPTWVEQLGRSLGLARSARPAFRLSNAGATNYAVGGARARDTGEANLSAQVEAFLGALRGAPAPSDALYVIEMGSNDIRDVLVTQDASIVTDALGSIIANIGQLYANGARKFLVWYVPNVGLTPAVRAAGPQAVAAATGLTQLFNANLEQLLQANFGGVDIVRYDVNQTLNAVFGNPGAFGLNVDAPCITPGVPPFKCKNADGYLFWDGIHPTTAAHGIIAGAAAKALGL